jgi:hypothetical protein
VGIENGLHWVPRRHVRRGPLQVRTGSGLRVMAALRNLAIGMLRLVGAINIAAGLCWAARTPPGRCCYWACKPLRPHSVHDQLGLS